MNRDIKNLLGSAIGDEPPLRIDRDAVFDAGRKRLRRRRLIQSSSVVAAVVVAAVGAATLTGLNPYTAPAPSMPPAASQTGGPATTSSDIPTTNHEPPPSLQSPVDQTASLTAQLYAVLPREYMPTEPTRPQFHEKAGDYFFGADVTRPTSAGAFQLTVEFDHTRDAAQCTDVPAQTEGCTTQLVAGMTVAYGDFEYLRGERGVSAAVVLPGRVLATATATNYPAWVRQKNKEPAGSPVFTKSELADILVRAGFHAG